MRGHPKGDSVGQPSTFEPRFHQWTPHQCLLQRFHSTMSSDAYLTVLFVVKHSRWYSWLLITPDWYWYGDWYSHFWKPLGEPWRFLFLRLFFLLFSYRQPFFQRVCAQEVTMFQNSSNKKAQYPKPYQSVRDNLVPDYSKSLSYISLLCVFGQFSVFRSSCLMSLVHSFISLF